MKGWIEMRRNANALLTVAIVIMTLMVASCKKESKLQQSVRQANKGCPVSIGVSGEMTAVTLDESTNTVIIDYLMNEKYFNIDVMKTKTDMLKEQVYSLIATAEGDVKVMTEELLAADANLTLRYTGKDSGKTVEITLSSKEIKQARETGEAFATPMKLLENAILLTNEQAPMTVDAATTMTELVIEGDFATYHYMIDEKQVPIHKISDMRDQMKENLRSTIKNNPDPALKDFINLCKKANKGIAYRYEGMQSGNTCTIEFTTDEL